MTDPQLDHALARLLVTAPDERVRDPARGLALARSVHRRAEAMETGETLALALAAVGRCAEAIEQERSLRTRAERVGNLGLADRVSGRLSHFERTGSCLPPWSA